MPAQDVASSDRWRESIRRSRTRRAEAFKRRRRRLRSRGAALSLAAVFAVSAAGAGVATGQSSASYLATGSEGPAVSAVEEALGLPADGYFDERTHRAVIDFQTENGLAVDGIVGPETSAALGLSSAEPAPAPAGGGSSAASPQLEAIAQCESGGDPTAVSADGLYRGKYQFTRETWASLGGTGDPAAAPEAVQDELAAKLLAQAGTSPWPNCG